MGGWHGAGRYVHKGGCGARLSCSRLLATRQRQDPAHHRIRQAVNGGLLRCCASCQHTTQAAVRQSAGGRVGQRGAGAPLLGGALDGAQPRAPGCAPAPSPAIGFGKAEDEQAPKDSRNWPPRRTQSREPRAEECFTGEQDR